jgi:hypothetical protein
MSEHQFVTVNTTPNTGCSWTALPSAAWIEVLQESGSGDGAFLYFVGPNSGPARSGQITVASQVFTINQAGVCSYTLNPQDASIGAAGATGQTFQIQTTSGCPSTATSNDSWIMVTGGATGNGTRTVTYTVLANSGAARTGTITAGGQTFTVNQAGAGGVCTYSLNPISAEIPVSGAAQQMFEVLTTSGCAWTATSNVAWIQITDGASGSGQAPVFYHVEVNPGPARSGTITAGGQTFTVNQAGSAACTYSLNPTSAQIPVTGAAEQMFNVETASGCAWTAASNDSWIQITGGASGNGPGTVFFHVNSNEDPARTGTITAGGQTFTVNQTGACGYVLSPTHADVAGAGATGQTFQVQTTSGCGWSATSNDTWITTTSGVAGTGTGTVTYSVAANSGPARTGTITVEGRTFTVNQAGNCGYTLFPVETSVGAAGASGQTFDVQTATGCGWSAASNDTWITITGGASGTGTGTVTFNVASNSGAARNGTITAGGQTFTVNQLAVSCSYDLSPFAAESPAAGATGRTFQVLTTSECGWSAVANAAWITVTAGSPGQGNGTVTYDVAPNGGAARTGTITAGGHTFTVNQAAACSFSPIPSEASFAAEGATGQTFQVITSEGCAWTASPSISWIVLTGGTSGTGSGSVTYSVLANDERTSRSGSILLGSASFIVNQAGLDCPAISVTPASLPAGEVGSVYDATLSASGGTSPYTWSLQGTLPGGLSFSGGRFTGTPTEGGTFNLTTSVVDAKGCSGQKAYVLTVTTCQKPTVPSFVSVPEAMAAGSPFTVSWSPSLGADTLGNYEIEVATGESCANPKVLTTKNSWITISTVSGQSVVYCLRVRAVSGQACKSDFSTAAKVNVKAPPAVFTVVGSAPALTAEKDGPVPANVEVIVRNIGSAAGNIFFWTAGRLFVPSPLGATNVLPGQDVRVRLDFVSFVTQRAGSETAMLVGTWQPGPESGTLSLPVTLTVLEGPATESKGSRLQYVGTNEVYFRHSGSGDPAPQTVTIVNTGTEPVRLAHKVGPGGAWLSVKGDFVTPLPAKGTRQFDLSVNRVTRTAEEDGASPVVTGLLFVNVDGNPEDSAYGQVIDSVSAAPGAGAGRSSLGPNQYSLIIGSAVAAGGVEGARYLSDGWIRNQSGGEVLADLYWTPGGQNGLTGESVKKNSLRLAPYVTFRLADLVNDLFQANGQSGQIEIRSSQLAQLSVRSTVDSITTRDGVMARYGAEVPIVASGQGVRKGSATAARTAKPGVLASNDSIAILVGLRDGEAGFRTNLIFAETGGKEATVGVKLYDVTGNLVGQKNGIYLGPYSKAQVNRDDPQLFPSGVRFDGGTAEVFLEAGDGSVAAFATVLDNKSNSYATRGGEVFVVSETTGAVRKATPLADGDSAFLPAAARSTAANNSYYTTRLVMANLSRNATQLTVTYLEDKRFGGKSVTRTVTVPARAEGPRAVVFDDVVTQVFEITENTAGMIKFGGNLSPISVASETSTPIDVTDLSKGRAIAAVNPAPGKPENQPYGVYSTLASEVVGIPASGASQSVVTHPAVEEGFAFRTNLILAELAGETAEVKVRLKKSGQQGASLAEKTYGLDRNERLQINRVVIDVLGVENPGAADFKDLEIQVEAVGGNGRVLSIVTKIDNNPASKRADIFVLGGTVAGSPVSFGD